MRKLLLLGILFINSIILNAQTITVNDPSPLTYCAGSNISVSFSITGSFTSGNIFTCELSDSSGSFAAPISIGTLIDTLAGTINGMIPANTIAGINYKVRVYSSTPSDTSSANTTSIIINAMLTTAAAGPDQAVIGTTATLAGNVATVGTGTWTLVSGAGTITTPASPTSGITALGVGANVFQWTISNGVCPSNADSVTITRVSSPTMTSASVDTICSGSAVSIPLTSNVPCTYTWKAVNNSFTLGESITVQSSSTLSNTITNNSLVYQTVVYTVTPTSIAGGIVGTPQTVMVRVNPKITMSSTTSVTVCSGSAVNLPFTTSGVPCSFSWVASDNSNTTGESITAQATDTLTDTLNNNVSTVQTVVYTITPTSIIGGCVGTSQTVNVKVNAVPKMTSASSATICSGNTVHISLTSSVPASYSWLAADDTNTTGESLTAQIASSLSNTIIDTATSVESVIYTVNLTSTTGSCVGTPQTFTVTVNPKPTMTSVSTDTLCSGDVLSISFTSSVASSYSWKATSNTNISGESITTQTTSTLNNTLINNSTLQQTVVYTVIPTSTIGSCAGTAQMINAVVNPKPIMTSANTVTICDGGIASIPLTTSGVPSTYTWLATDNSNTIGESITAQTTDTLTDTLSNSATTLQSVNYTVTPTSTTGGCAGTAQMVSVKVKPELTMTSSSSATICSGSAIHIPLTSSVASTYSWIAVDDTNTVGESLTPQTSSTINNTLTDTTTTATMVTYTVTPTSTSGACVGTPQTVTVTVNPTPMMTSTSMDTICSGTTVSIPLTSDIASTYSWKAANNANTTGESIIAQTTTTLSNTISNNTTTLQTVTYSVTPTSTTGSCAGAPQTVLVMVNPLPTVMLDLSSVDTLCNNASAITLTGGSPLGGAYSGVGVTAGMFDPTTVSASTHTIMYSYTDSNSCVNTASDVIWVEVCAGVNELSDINNVIVYPNPFAAEITMEMTFEKNENVKIELINILGKTVQIIDQVNMIGAYKKHISTSQLPNGIYFISIQTNEHTVFRKVVKN